MYHKTPGCLRSTIGVLFCTSLLCSAEVRGSEITVFSKGQVRCYLDLSGAEALSQTQAHRLELNEHLRDLSTCLRKMTGVSLPRSPA